MYSPTDKDTWTGRVDTNEGDLGLRWHQKVKSIDLSVEELPALKVKQNGIVIIGFMSDEGVRRNKGRTGAKEGPAALRKACCNHAYHFHEETLLFDAGNVRCIGEDLEGAQAALRQVIKKIRSAGFFPFVFGGGHEVAYPHFMGVHDGEGQDKTIGVINFDAHFDLRIPEIFASSGTPFYQISQQCELAKRPFKYFCLGIQESANTQALFNRAENLGTEYILASDCRDARLATITSKIHDFSMEVDALYLTICLDVFDVAFAPGVSAPTAIGLKPEIALSIIKEITSSGKLIAADIAELNPSFDHNNMTANLAAKLAYEIMKM